MSVILYINNNETAGTIIFLLLIPSRDKKYKKGLGKNTDLTWLLLGSNLLILKGEGWEYAEGDEGRRRSSQALTKFLYPMGLGKSVRLRSNVCTKM